MAFDLNTVPTKRCRSTNSTLENNKILPNFLITAASTQGGRRYMEDRLQIEVERKVDGQLDFVYAAVYDGHGGTQASEYVRQHLFNNIVNNPSFSSDDDHLVLEAIREGFLRTHSDMRREAMHWPPTVSGFPCTAGTTATCAFVRNGKLYTGHVGDSTIVLANFAETDAGFKDAKLTDDHKPDLTSERERIERAGGAVAIKSGIFRVIWKRPIRGHRGPVRRSTSTENIPFLAVARSLGDFWSLNPISNEYIVSPEPDVDVFELKDTDNFVVVASDGLTTVVGVRALIEVLRETEQRHSTQHSNNENGGSTGDRHGEQLVDFGEIDTELPLNHARCLLQYTLKRWSTLRADNISIICIKLNADESSPSRQSVLLEGQQSFSVFDAMMTEHPMAMLRVTANDTQLLRTNPVQLLSPGRDGDSTAGRDGARILAWGIPFHITPSISPNSSVAEQSISTSSLITMPRPASPRLSTPVTQSESLTTVRRGVKRRRLNQDDIVTFDNTSSSWESNGHSNGNLVIGEVDKKGQFISVINKGKEDVSVGGWLLKSVAGGREVSYKFNSRLSVKAGKTITVWSSNSGQEHQPPNNLVFKIQQWPHGDAIRTELSNSDREVEAWKAFMQHSFTCTDEDTVASKNCRMQHSFIRTEEDTVAASKNCRMQHSFTRTVTGKNCRIM